MSKLELDSGSRRSMLIVRHLSERVASETCWIIDMFAAHRCELALGSEWTWERRSEGAEIPRCVVVCVEGRGRWALLVG